MLGRAAYLPWRGRCRIRVGSFEGPSREALMRWLWLGVVVLSGMTMTGCPSEFGKDGRVAKAVHDDSQENLLMLKGCSQAFKDAVCGNGPDKDQEKCRKCGGP